MLAVDFDGVVCDALVECAAVTWFAPHPEVDVADQPIERLIGDIPPSFRDVFATVRNYSRLLDHFMVALYPAAEQVVDQVSFDAAFAAIPPAQLTHLVTNAGAIRDRWRTTQTERWLDLHTLYPGIDTLLRRHAGKVVVVTAKDETSVWDILGHHRLADTVSDVVGECADKPTALRQLSARHGVDLTEVTFIDDNVSNARRVGAIGARAYWARWGYHTPEHAARAHAAGLPPLDLDDLPALSDTLGRPAISVHSTLNQLKENQ